MSDEEQPGAPEAQDGGPSGKLIAEDVFRSRLAARQEALADQAGQAEALSTLEEALKSLGIFSDGLGLSPLAAMRAAPMPFPEPETGDARLSAEDLAVERLFLDELEAGRRPRLDDYLQRYPGQREALLRLATRLDPRELAGLPTRETNITPEARAAVDLGQREGEVIAMRMLAAARPRRRRRRSMPQVAEERAPYDVTTADGAPDAPHAQPARPAESGPER